MKASAYLASLIACVPIAGMAADFDGSKQLLCATVEAIDCVDGYTCVKGRPGDIGAPSFIRIDFAKKSIVGPYTNTPIASIQKSADAGELLLQGQELGHGWMLSLNTHDGSLGATLLNREGAFVLFGACAPI